MSKAIFSMLAIVASVTSSEAAYVKAKPGNDAARAEAYCGPRLFATLETAAKYNSREKEH